MLECTKKEYFYAFVIGTFNYLYLILHGHIGNKNYQYN